MQLWMFCFPELVSEDQIDAGGPSVGRVTQASAGDCVVVLRHSTLLSHFAKIGAKIGCSLMLSSIVEAFGDQHGCGCPDGASPISVGCVVLAGQRFTGQSVGGSEAALLQKACDQRFAHLRGKALAKNDGEIKEEAVRLDDGVVTRAQGDEMVAFPERLEHEREQAI